MGQNLLNRLLYCPSKEEKTGQVSTFDDAEERKSQNYWRRGCVVGNFHTILRSTEEAVRGAHYGPGLQLLKARAVMYPEYSL